MTKIDKVRFLIEAFQNEVRLGKDDKANRDKGGQHTNGHYPIFRNLVPSQYKEIEWYCKSLLAILDEDDVE